MAAVGLGGARVMRSLHASPVDFFGVGAFGLSGMESEGLGRSLRGPRLGAEKAKGLGWVTKAFIRFSCPCAPPPFDERGPSLERVWLLSALWAPD